MGGEGRPVQTPHISLRGKQQIPREVASPPWTAWVDRSVRPWPVTSWALSIPRTCVQMLLKAGRKVSFLWPERRPSGDRPQCYLSSVQL